MMRPPHPLKALRGEIAIPSGNIPFKKRAPKRDRAVEVPCPNMAKLGKCFCRFRHMGIWRFKSNRPRQNTGPAAETNFIHAVLVIQVCRAQEMWGHGDVHRGSRERPVRPGNAEAGQAGVDFLCGRSAWTVHEAVGVRLKLQRRAHNHGLSAKKSYRH